MALSDAMFYLEDKWCDTDQEVGCTLVGILYLAHWLLLSLPIIIIAADVWSAFKKRKHWIPGESLVLGALALQLLSLLNSHSLFDAVSEEVCSGLDDFKHYHIPVFSGRVSVCVLMGCLLPGVHSTTLWSDMVALIISSSISLLHIFYDAYVLASFESCDHDMLQFSFMRWAHVIIAVSIIFLLLILSSAALASLAIPRIVSPKIPTIFFPPNLHTKFGWEKVEEQVTKSWIVVRTSDPAYIITRSCLSSSVALVISVCNGFLICQMLVFRKHLKYYILNVIDPLPLRWAAIVVGSFVIYWRCITQVVYYPKKLEWRFSSFSQYFRIEEFWKYHLLGLMRRSRTHGQPGRRCLIKMILKLCGIIRLHKLLYVLLWLQMFCVLFSKFCFLLFQLLLSNKYFGKLLMGSAYEEFSTLYRSEIRLGESCEYYKYMRELVSMEGENSAGLWIANRKSIDKIKKCVAKGEDEGKQCSDLISLLVEKSSADFCGEKCVKPQNEFLNRLDVEKELDVLNCSWKMTAISIIAVLIELSSFDHDEAEAKIMLKRCTKACSQAWSIMEMVEENNASEHVEVSIAADEIFQSLEKRHKWLEYSLPMSRPVEKSPAAAKAAIRNLVEKGKEIANKHCLNKPSEAIAGYSLYRMGKVSMNEDCQFNSVEEVCDRMCRMLADVMGSCCVKVAGVIMEDCRKLATKSDEESVLKIARVAGKVKKVIERVGWTLKWRSDAESSSINTSLETDGATALRRYRSFQIG